MNNNQLLTNYYIIHRDELLAYVSSRLGKSDLAEDIVQDVFLRLLLSDKLISEVTLPALVYTIARHITTSVLRRRVCHEQFEHVIRRNSSLEGLSPESVFSAQEITERLERGLARLPENCREVYRLHIYGGLKVSEISSQLGEDYKSVEHRLGTARKAIRHYLRMYA